MGLDIYLTQREIQKANDAHEKAWEEVWEKYHDKETGQLKAPFTEEQYKEAQKDVPPYQSLSSQPTRESKYPDHYMNPRYLRSSYNESGFNRAVPDMIGEDHGFYWIFDPVIEGDDEPYEFVLVDELIPNLEECRDRALQVAAEIRASDPLRVTQVTSMLGSPQHEHMWQEKLPSDDQTLAWYREEKDRKAEQLAKWQEAHPGEELPQWMSEESGYSSAKGDIFGFTKGLEVLGATLGTNCIGQPCANLVYRLSDETKEHYAQSAEIAAEFCEEAIDLIKTDGSAYMHWSG